jgi:hypothetical protein
LLTSSSSNRAIGALFAAPLTGIIGVKAAFVFIVFQLHRAEQAA